MKRKRGILFLICLAGGVLFGALFFALFGVEAGYSWFLAELCAAGGLVFAVAFFLIWLVVEKHSKPITFEDLGAQNRLQENEKNFESYEARYHGRIPQGSGLKSAVCETYIYLLPDRLRICYSYFRKIFTIDVDYNCLLVKADDEGFFLIKCQDGGISGRLIDDDVASFCNRLREKGVHVQDEDPFSRL